MPSRLFLIYLLSVFILRDAVRVVSVEEKSGAQHLTLFTSPDNDLVSLRPLFVSFVTSLPALAAYISIDLFLAGDLLSSSRQSDYFAKIPAFRSFDSFTSLRAH